MNQISSTKNAILLILCLVNYVFRGKANRVSDPPRSVLIVRWKNNIGDIVYITPLFAAIKKKYPGCKVYLLGSGRAEEVVRYNPDLDGFINFDGSVLGAIKNVKALKADFACIANMGSTPGFAIPYLAGIKGISLFEKKNKPRIRSRSYNILRKLGIQVPFFSGRYVVGQYLGLLSPINIETVNTQFKLYFSEKAQRVADEMLADRRQRELIVGMAPGGSTPDRWWPADKFASLADHLHSKHNAKIFLLGAGKDLAPIGDVVAKAKCPVVNLVNQSLDEYKAFISKTDLIIGNDSGTMVTADAFSVPNLVFVGDTNEKEYHLPPGPFNRVLKAPSGQVNEISLEDAIEEVEVIIGNLKNNNGEN